jgi:hypothetical protein
LESFLSALEVRTRESEQRAATGSDRSRAAEQLAARAVSAARETFEQLNSERTKIAHLSSALAEQTAKSLLLETRVRSLERTVFGWLTEKPREREGVDSRHRERTNERLVETQAEECASRDDGSAREGKSGRGDDGNDGATRATSSSDGPRVSLAAARNFQAAASCDSSRGASRLAAHAETGAFIDFYSGVLGVDRAQLTMKRCVDREEGATAERRGGS